MDRADREGSTTHDTIIIGGGPAGLTAAIYAARARMDTLLVERTFPGGLMMISEYIENYPGFSNGVSGPDLCLAMQAQAEKFGAQVMLTDIQSVNLTGPEKIIRTSEGELKARTVIIATGARPRRLGVPGEKEFQGRGVSYCATCDGPFFKGKKLAVIGGGDTAVEDSVYLTRFADDVTIIHRRDRFRAAKIIQERALANPHINVLWDSVVQEIHGNPVVEQIKIKNVKNHDLTDLKVDGVFILIGQEPDTAFLADQVTRDSFGYIPTDAEMHTNLPGVFAAGDVRQKTLRQIVTACADGAMAATSAEKYLESLGL
ncbi:MAG: thioredoxin-disulfide reductase [Armatimonadetes bacterium]|nr:thioredoxin-disulfide reductase [Armatimonadota bacterium]